MVVYLEHCIQQILLELKRPKTSETQLADGVRLERHFAVDAISLVGC